MTIVLCKECGSTMSCCSGRCLRCKGTALVYYTSIHNAALRSQLEFHLFRRKPSSALSSMFSVAAMATATSAAFFLILHAPKLLQMAHLTS
jgi:predicted ATP-dependent serine protease